jgi:hypothetical protein
MSTEDRFPEGDAHGPICGDPCPEAPDLSPCLMVPGHYGPWHRNRSSAWPVAEEEGEQVDPPPVDYSAPRELPGRGQG